MQTSRWDENPHYPLADWRAEVANDDTRLGYGEWVVNKQELDGRLFRVRLHLEIKAASAAEALETAEELANALPNATEGLETCCIDNLNEVVEVTR